MPAIILTDEQQKLLDIMKCKQKEWGQEMKLERVVPKTVIVHASELSNRMWGSANDDQLEKVMAMVSKLVAAKAGVRLMRLREDFDEALGKTVPVVWYRYSPVGKERTQKLVEAQKSLGRKRRQIFATDEEWTAAVKLIEEMRHATISLDTPQ